MFLKTHNFWLPLFIVFLSIPFFALANPQNPEYIIQGKVDEQTHTFIAHQTIKNIPFSLPSDTLFFILPPNKFQNGGVQAMLENELGYVKEDFSEIRLIVQKIKIDGKEVSPSIKIGEYTIGIPTSHIKSTSIIEIDYTVILPSVIVRDIGMEEDKVLLGQFYPYIAPINNNQWELNPPHAFVEESLSLSDYEVALTLPKKFTAIATSGKNAIQENADSTITVVTKQENAIEFALYGAVEKDIQAKTISGITVSLLCDYNCNSEKIFYDTKFILEYYEENIGKFPFSSLDIVIGRHGDLGGKEYPGMVILNIDEGFFTSWIPRMEMLLFHEIAHQYFYASIVSNQYNAAWIDEGLVTYLHRKALWEYVKNENFLVQFLYWMFIILEKFFTGHTDHLNTTMPGESFSDRLEYKKSTYGDGALYFESFEENIGTEKMQEFLKNLYKEYQWKSLSSVVL